MNYVSLYNMRSCFTVKRGRDPRDPWHRRRHDAVAGSRGSDYRWGGYSDTKKEERERDRWGNISRINFAIGEFYVRAGSIHYGQAFAATSIHLDRPFGSWACIFSLFLAFTHTWLSGLGTIVLSFPLHFAKYLRKQLECVCFAKFDIAIFINYKTDS